MKSIFKKSYSSSDWISVLGNSSFNQSKLTDSDMLSFFTSWQYAAITAIADSISSLNYRLADSNDNDLEHDYLSYITPELIQNITIFMKMTGTAYVLKVMHGNSLLGLSMLLPQYISPVIDENGNLRYWNYSGGSRGSVRLEKTEVMVFAEFNPYQRYPYITRGYSPLQALAMTVKGEKEIEKWNYSLLTNDVPPGMILTTDKDLAPQQVLEIKEEWEKTHSGSVNVGKLAILPFGIKPSSLQSSPKEMEFISQQEWNRDKILAIYKVPKAVIGIGEGVNVGNVKAFNQIFASRCIEPLAKKIARVFNDEVFKGIGVFEFLNILPSDEEAVKEHYLAGGITKNEYRQEIGYKPIKGGDVFVNGEEAVVERNENSVDNEFARGGLIDYKSIVRKNIPYSEEWMRERLERKEERMVGYEEKLKIGFLKIFERQEKDVLASGEVNLGRKYFSLYVLILKESVFELVEKEGERALEEVKGEGGFEVRQYEKEIVGLIRNLAKEIDSTTEKQLKKLSEIKSIDKEGIQEVFKELKEKRLDLIVQTESVRFTSLAENLAWKLSGKVKYKQWWTAVDERRCERCGRLHGKKVGIDEEFEEGVIGGPLHPRCRCLVVAC